MFGNISKAIGGGAGSIGATVITILGLLPDDVKARMDFWQWLAVIAVAGVGGFAVTYFFPRNDPS